MNIDGHTRPQIVTKLLLQISVRELHNSLVSDPVGVVVKEATYAENIIIIGDSTLLSLLQPQLNKRHQDTRSCVVVNVLYLPKVYIHY